MPLRRLIALILLFLPAVASALAYGDATAVYRDAPFPRQSAVAISILTSLDAVSGYPDGTFRPSQMLNRGEAMKMVFLSSPAHAALNPRRCFQDVLSSNWFSPYVCAAKDAGVVQGFLDGRFHPERPVLYAEALKMLALSYGYALTREDADAWYSPYVRAADHQGVSLEEEPMALSPLTRAQMARLAVAFRADHDHELALYRQQEAQASSSSSAGGNSSVASFSSSQGHPSTSSFSSSPPRNAVSMSAASIPSSASSTSSPSSASPAVAGISSSASSVQVSFIQLGQRSGALASVTLMEKEEMRVHVAKVQCSSKLLSIAALYLLDARGAAIAELLPDTFDPSGKSWIGTVPTDQPYILPANASVTIEVTAQVRSADQGGIAGETVQVSKMSLVVESGAGQETSELLLQPASPFPVFETH